MSSERPAQGEPAGGGTGDAQFAAELRAAFSLAAAADALAASTPSDRLLDLLVRAATRAIPSPEGALLLVDPERRVLTFDVVVGQTAAKVKDLTVPLGRGIAGLVAVSGQSLAISNAQQDPRHARDIAERSGFLPNTILAVPVAGADGAVLGVLELLERQGQPTYDLRDMDLLGVFAQGLALVLEQRRAHASVAALVGRALAALGGLRPSVERTIAERTAIFAAAVEADPQSRRMQELAELVATVASRGESEHRACLGVLEAFADYARASSGLGGGMELLQ